MHNRETGSTIGFVGMIHAGNQEYYDDIAEYLRGAEKRGSVVHYEGVKKAVEGDELPEEWVEEAAEAFGQALPADLIIRHVRDAKKQREALAYQDHWQNHDVSMHEVVQRLGSEVVSEFVKDAGSISKAESEFGPEKFGKFLRKVLLALPTLAPLKDLLKLGDRRMHDVIVTYRNEVALRAVRRQIAAEPGRDITLLWGAGHGPGVIKGLERLGYRKLGTTWLNALTVEPPL